MRKIVFLTVRRRCLVCDWSGECEEPATTDEIGGACAICRAPTERLDVVGRRTTLAERNPHAAALGRLGGIKGGPARAAALSPEQRRDIARHASRERWRKAKA
jgi:hypothetical protein